MPDGALMIVGSGIQLGAHLTLAAQAWIHQADKVLFAAADPLTIQWLTAMNPSAEALPYRRTPRRRETYQLMVERIMAAVRQDQRVCVVFYGHPGIFADAPHLALRQARAEGYFAQMMPGISALDCLFADLSLDPGRMGCQTFEATDFLIRQRTIDPTTPLVLWQVGVVGNRGFYEPDAPPPALPHLVARLAALYGAAHEVVLYEAAIYPTLNPRMDPCAVAELPAATLTDVTTLYVPPLTRPPLDDAMVAALGWPLAAPDVSSH